jgi:hypothetical protein
MRFRFGLPLLQTIAMLLILWSPWNPHAHELRLKFIDGGELSMWTLLPEPDVNDWAQGINLPALLCEIPIDLVIEGFEKEPQFPGPNMRFFLFWSVGALVWYMVGRFIEDVAIWRRAVALPRPRLTDLAFAVEAALVALLAVLASAFGGRVDSAVLSWSSAAWLVIAYAALAFRLLQLIQHRRRPQAA